MIWNIEYDAKGMRNNWAKKRSENITGQNWGMKSWSEYEVNQMKGRCREKEKNGPNE